MNKVDNQSREFEWTGERYVPFVHGDIEIEHLHRYAFARELVVKKDVLDIACGEGYGSHILAQRARTVIGVDISEVVVLHAQQKYTSSNLQFRHGDCARIPLENCSVDIVVSFETIEHHNQHEAMLSEIKRVLRPDGMLIISTPVRNFEYKHTEKCNDFHVKELSQPEFRDLLLQYFKNFNLVGQKVRYGSLITSLDLNEMGQGFSFHSGNAKSISSHLIDPNPIFLIALASQYPIQVRESSFFDNTDYLLESIATLRLDRDALSAEVERVKKTVSWRLTKPLRFIWNRLRLLTDINLLN